MRGRMWAYLLRYQLRDYALLRAGLPVFLVVFIGWMVLKTDAARIDWASPQGQRWAVDLFRNLASVFINLSVFLGVSRLVTDDRSNGYFRFLFSKPVSIERFYVQQWVMHGTGFVLIGGALTAWMQAETAALPVREAMLVVGLTWILIGGVGFAFNALTNLDAFLLLVAWVMSSILHSVKDSPYSEMWGWLRQVTRFTLPVHKLDYIKAELFAGNPLPVSHTLHVVLYGLAGFAVAIVLLRRTSFGR